LKQALLAQIHNLDMDRRVVISDNLRKLSLQANPFLFTFGAMFVGSGIGTYVLDIIKEIMESKFHVSIIGSCAFLCEPCDWKRAWAMAFFKPPCCFVDPAEMNQVRAKDEITGNIVNIEAVDMLLAIFDCETLAQVGASCSTDAPGRAGRHAAHVLAYISAYIPLTVILETTPPISNKGKTDLQSFTYKLEGMGYDVTSSILEAKTYQVPQLRDRVYIVGACTARRSCDPHPEFMKLINSTLRLMQSTPPPKLSLMLAPCDHPSVTALARHRRDQFKAKEHLPGSAAKEFEKFEADHMEAFLELGLTTYPPDDNAFTSECMRILPRRQRELALYFEHVLKACSDETVHDLSFNLKHQRSDVRPEECHPLTPASVPWLLLRRREMTGDEALTLQGYDYCLQTKQGLQSDFTNVQKFDIAGESMNAYVLGAIVTCVLTFVDWRAARTARAGIEEDGFPGQPTSTSDCFEENAEEEVQSNPDLERMSDESDF